MCEHTHTHTHTYAWKLQCTKLVEDNFDMIWKLIKLEVVCILIVHPVNILEKDMVFNF